MNMFDWYKKCLRQYADFSGRARRSEYWYFSLVNVLITLIFWIVFFFLLGAGVVIGDSTNSRAGEAGLNIAGILLVSVYGLYYLAMFIPTLAVVVRRLHDTGKSGWFYLTGLIPAVGAIILIIFFATDSEPGTNQWGANPKEIENQELNKFE